MTPITIPAENSVLILGAGAAGMRSAIELADLGSRVFLVEREFFVGGRVAQWGKMATTDQTGEEIVTGLYNQIRTRKNIQVYTGAHIISSKGRIVGHLIKVSHLVMSGIE